MWIAKTFDQAISPLGERPAQVPWKVGPIFSWVCCTVDSTSLGTLNANNSWRIGMSRQIRGSCSFARKIRSQCPVVIFVISAVRLKKSVLICSIALWRTLCVFSIGNGSDGSAVEVSYWVVTSLFYSTDCSQINPDMLLFKLLGEDIRVFVDGRVVIRNNWDGPLSPGMPLWDRHTWPVLFFEVPLFHFYSYSV